MACWPHPGPLQGEREQKMALKVIASPRPSPKEREQMELGLAYSIPLRNEMV